MADIALRVSDVKSSSGNFSVQGIDFNLESGDVMGLVGKSGSGKSTLIKGILKLKETDRGQIWAERNGKEVDVKNVSGYSPQENSLYPFLSIQENLESFGRLRGVSEEKIEERSKDLLKKLEIFSDKNKLVSELSGGMKKRADLACCLLHEPKIIVLDEPFSGIDPPQREIIWKILEKQKQEGKIIVLTSHMLKEISRKCNKIGLIKDGEFYRSSKIENIMKESDYENVETFLNDVFRF